MSSSSENGRNQVKSIIEAELARVQTPDDAEAVVRRAEQLSASTTEDRAGERAAEDSQSGASSVDEAQATAPAEPAGAADALVETAAQAVAPTPEAAAVVEATQEAIGTAHQAPPSAPAARRGRSLLRQAVLRRMGPVQALDARLYLHVNGQAHPHWLDRTCKIVTVVTTGGWIWIVATTLANRLNVPGSGPAVQAIIPAVIGSTWLAEYPVKAYFRRRRPFIDVVRALVVGKEPGSWSFPSGHTCAAFAAAWTLSRFWPAARPALFGGATLVGYSRIYAGAHYPGDVVSGAVFGIIASECIRRVTDKLLI